MARMLDPKSAVLVTFDGRMESGRQPSGIIGCPTLVLVAESGKRPCGIPWVQGGMWQAAVRQTLGSGWNAASGNAADPGFRVECGKRPCGRPWVQGGMWNVASVRFLRPLSY